MEEHLKVEQQNHFQMNVYYPSPATITPGLLEAQSRSLAAFHRWISD